MIGVDQCFYHQLKVSEFGQNVTLWNSPRDSQPQYQPGPVQVKTYDVFFSGEKREST